MKHVIKILVLMFCLSALVAQADEKTDKMRSRLEQLFIWRVADRLQLTVPEESKFSQEFKKISDEKADLNRQSEKILSELDKTRDDKEKSSEYLREYLVVFKKLNDLQEKELKSMEHLLGTRKMVEYLLLKKEMALKFKDVLSHGGSPAGGQNAGLKEPKIITDK